MTDLGAALSKHGIHLRDLREGEHKTKCPQCSQARKKKRDPCLSVKIDGDGGACWNCWHCGDTGNIPGGRDASHHQSRRRRDPPRERPRPVEYERAELPEKVVAWFRGRGISEATLLRNRIGYGPHFIPAKNVEVTCIQFPYLYGGEVVNVKYRTGDKRFAQTKGGAKTLYGIDDIAGADSVIFVEGEMDKLALEEADYLAVVSLPDGAPPEASSARPEGDRRDDKRYTPLEACADALEGIERFIIATDADGPGNALAEELARRLGREHCYRVKWPTINDAPCKDANEVLIQDGADVLRECIEAAEPWPILGLYRASDFQGRIIDLYHHGHAKAYSTGWLSLDPFVKIRPGELSIVTGIPNGGKSEWVDAVMVNLAIAEGWRFAVCSFENPPEEHLAKLAEKYTRAPFGAGPTSRMGEEDLKQALNWINDHFFFIRADDEAPTFDWILERAKAAVLRHGVHGVVIDPYNEVEHRRPSNQSETEYVGQILGKAKRFAQAHGAHFWFVGHPTKVPRENGKTPPPSLYDISGSANWANKADVGITVHRPDYAVPQTEIYIRKVRFKTVGKVGRVTLAYDKVTGRYSDAA